MTPDKILVKIDSIARAKDINDAEKLRLIRNLTAQAYHV